MAVGRKDQNVRRVTGFSIRWRRIVSLNKRENKITDSKNLTPYNVLLTNFIPRYETCRQIFD